MPEAFIALGSNLGNPHTQLTQALLALSRLKNTELLACAPFYQTAPMGGPQAQPAYLNSVCVVATDLPPAQLMSACLWIEQTQHRIRIQRFGPRTLDLDVLAYDQALLQSDHITLPHPRVSERLFCLVPWHNLNPHAYIPSKGYVKDCIRLAPPCSLQQTQNKLCYG